MFNYYDQIKRNNYIIIFIFEKQIIILLIACVIKLISIVVKTTAYELLRTYGVWEIRAGVQVFKREFHIHIYFFF